MIKLRKIKKSGLKKKEKYCKDNSHYFYRS